MRACPDVVDREYVVIDDPFDEVEQPPADEHRSEEGTSADRPSPMGRAAPEDVETTGDGEPRGGVKESVPERVRLEPGNGGGRIAALAREHVMPLKDLVEHDPVDEAPEPDAEQDRRGARAREWLLSLTTWADGHRATQVPSCAAVPNEDASKQPPRRDRAGRGASHGRVSLGLETANVGGGLPSPLLVDRADGADLTVLAVPLRPGSGCPRDEERDREEQREKQQDEKPAVDPAATAPLSRRLKVLRLRMTRPTHPNKNAQTGPADARTRRSCVRPFGARTYR